MMRILLLFLLVPNWLFSQKAPQHLRKGNELYKENNFGNAEIEYRKGLEINPGNWAAKYNLAASLYKQGKYKEAELILDSLRDKTRDNSQLSSVYHNLGNNYLKDKQFENSIEAYKKALKLKPDAEDTRYNLSYAMKKLQQQQQQQQNQQQQNQEKRKEEEAHNDPNADKQAAEKKMNLNREEAERMLDALNREEKDLRDKLNKQSKPGEVPASGKDW